METSVKDEIEIKWVGVRKTKADMTIWCFQSPGIEFGLIFDFDDRQWSAKFRKLRIRSEAYRPWKPCRQFVPILRNLLPDAEIAAAMARIIEVSRQ